MIKNSLSLTVAIPTCYGGRSLIRAIESIRKSNFNENFDIRVVADSIPIPRDIKQKLNKLDVILVENKQPGSQIIKVKQALKDSKTDIFVFTQDDIRFEPDVIKELVAAFEKNPEVTMVAAKIIPEKAHSLFEKIVNIGLSISLDIAGSWNKGDNYLSANGRCLAFRTSHLKKMKIPNKMVNTDGYLYIENKRIGGKFTVADKAVVYNPNPSVLAEQLRQTERFLYSRQELSDLFKKDISSEYKIPYSVFWKAVFQSFFKNPFLFICYIFIYFLGNLKLKFLPKDITPFWKINLSTKNISD